MAPWVGARAAAMEASLSLLWVGASGTTLSAARGHPPPLLLANGVAGTLDAR